jgi:Spy/CpxP family protein refolding chaperone
VKSLPKILGITMFTTAMLLAQTTTPPATPPNPANHVQRKVAHLTTLLDLNAQQQAQATTMFTNAQTASQLVFTNLKVARQSLATAVTANNTNDIAQYSNTIGNLVGQLTAIESNAKAQFYAILMPSQQSKLLTLESAGHLGASGRWGHAGMHHSPPSQ